MKDIERMLVSAHEDGEVASPWKEQIQSRIGDDPAWASEAAVHRSVKAALARDPEPDFSAARSRVAVRLRERTGSGSARHPQRILPMAWVSVAAAALLLVAAGGGFWLGRQSTVPGGAAPLAELQVQVPHQLELKLTGEGQLLMASTLERADP